MLTMAEAKKNWSAALQTADDRYHALREAVVYAEATAADPEMVKRWKQTLWNSPESEWPDLTSEVIAVRKKLGSKESGTSPNITCTYCFGVDGYHDPSCKNASRQ